MNILEQYEENGYTIIKYNNGTTAKIWGSINTEEPIIEPLTEEELFRIKVETELEYIKCITEINNGI